MLPVREIWLGTFFRTRHEKRYVHRIFTRALRHIDKETGQHHLLWSYCIRYSALPVVAILGIIAVIILWLTILIHVVG
ncbi:hypothetical protein DB346_11795 [Verrucomicrobia bacterium LW23]|nr:hypothetical protein DB346_11795 [Verrucomicrobia bacterium LW23]